MRICNIISRIQSPKFQILHIFLCSYTLKSQRNILPVSNFSECNVLLTTEDLYSEAFPFHINSYFFTDWFLPWRIPLQFLLVVTGFLGQINFQYGKKYECNTKNINKNVSKCDILHLTLKQKAESAMCMKMITDKGTSSTWLWRKQECSKRTYNWDIAPNSLIKIHFRMHSDNC